MGSFASWSRLYITHADPDPRVLPYERGGGRGESVNANLPTHANPLSLNDWVSIGAGGVLRYLKNKQNSIREEKNEDVPIKFKKRCRDA